MLPPAPQEGTEEFEEFAIRSGAVIAARQVYRNGSDYNVSPWRMVAADVIEAMDAAAATADEIEAEIAALDAEWMQARRAYPRSQRAAIDAQYHPRWVALRAKLTAIV